MEDHTVQTHCKYVQCQQKAPSQIVAATLKNSGHQANHNLSWNPGSQLAPKNLLDVFQ